MPAIQAVLFDSGNTLLDFRPSEERAIEILEQRTGRKVSEQEAAPFFEAAFRHAFGDGLGWVATRETELRYWASYYQGWLTAIGIEPEELLIAELVSDTLKTELYKAFPDSMPVLDELRDRGIKLALVSNAFPSMRLLIEHTRLDHFFDPAIYSCEVGCEKPNAEIFHLALDGTGIAPENTLFVDDLPSNIEAALALGIDAVLLDRWERHPHTKLPSIVTLYEVLERI